MEIKEPYVFYDVDGKLWRADFGSCDKLPNPIEMWAGRAVLINESNKKPTNDKENNKESN